MTTTMPRSETTTRTASGAGLMRDAPAPQAAGALGGEPGIPVAGGPGVVVVREFAAAVRLLDRC